MRLARATAIEREIGRGGMGVVYEAWDAQLERRVALKVIDFGPVEEARIAAQLEHPGLVPVYDSGTLPDGRAYYAMRLVRGRRLDEFLRQEPGLGERLRVLVKVCDAVAFAHDRGVIHCDLKPQNIMVGSFGEVFVMDWGIARRTRAVRIAGARTGTPPYLAPEHPAGPSRRYLLPRPHPPRPRGAIARFVRLAAVAARAMAVRSGRAISKGTGLRRGSDPLSSMDCPSRPTPENLWERTVRYVRRNQVLLLLIAAFLVVKLALFFFRRP